MEMKEEHELSIEEMIQTTKFLAKRAAFADKAMERVAILENSQNSLIGRLCESSKFENPMS